MKTIRKANKVIQKYLGPQFVEDNIEYIENKYVIRNENLYYNCLTDEIVLADKTEDRDQLIRRWYLVPKYFDIKSVDHLIRQNYKRTAYGPGSFLKRNYIIFTTTACNASCEYCFEKGMRPLTMSKEVGLDVANYIIKSHDPSRKFKIKWFGGEPLVNKEAINVISDALNDAKLNYYSDISSNGDLLDLCTDEELRNWKVTGIQFTLDAVGEEYDRIKGLPNGAYERLKKSVSRLEKLGIKAKIRIHVNTKKEEKPWYKIVDEFKDFSNVTMYARLLYQESSKSDYDELLALEDYITDNTGKVFFPIFSINSHCMADNSRMACITPNGELSPCEHYAYGELMYGSIYSSEHKYDVHKEWGKRRKTSEEMCLSCPLYPLCRQNTMCPAEGKCSEGYQYYQIETIKRALRKKVEEINGRDSNTDN